MTCPHCGTNLESGARFCGACGRRVQTPSVAAPAESSGPLRSLDAPDDESKPTSVVASTPSGAAQTRPGAGPPGPSPRRSTAGLRFPGVPPTGQAIRRRDRARRHLVGRTGPAAAYRPISPKISTHSAPTVIPTGSDIPGPPSGLRPMAPAPAPAPHVPGAVSPVYNRGERKSENSGSRDNMVGRTLNRRYVVGEKIGEGGFGAVFRGKQLATGRDVALKILHPYNVGDATIVARFRREAAACSTLRNPHTVITYDFDETDDGVLYLAMELLTGRSLHHLERAEGTLNPLRVLRIIDQVAEALGEAHANGIIHRDMKPENVFIERRADEDYVKVLDFGIAKIVSDERGGAALTAVGQTLGTLEFMSPEQLRGQNLDGRSDIYALGMMAYEMLTGHLPFKDAKTPVQIINFHLQSPPPPPSRLAPNANIPPDVDAVIMKMVAKSRDDRHANTSALRDHIADVLEASSSPPRRFEPYRIVAIAGAAALIVGALVYFLSR